MRRSPATRFRAFACALALGLALAGCAKEPACDVSVDGARLVASVAAAPGMALLGEALVQGGWNVTEGRTELAASKSYAALDAPPERQAVHLTLSEPAGYANLTTAQLSSHLAADGAEAAEETLGPAARDVLALLRPHLGEPTEILYEGC